jgi:hypothetical protein
MAKSARLLKLVDEIVAEYNRACALFPDWPDDAVHAAAIMSEEAGETLQAAIDFNFKSRKGGTSRYASLLRNMRVEAIQTGAMVLRILLGMDRYRNEHQRNGNERKRSV